MENGYVILKDKRGASQFLLLPTARISGIESPRILARDAPNYFAEAWEARRFVSAMRRQDLSRAAISLAINSKDARTQDQLHIHIDCVKGEVQGALRDLTFTSQEWRPFEWRGRAYRVKRVIGEQLTINPFQLLRDDVPQEEMAHHSLVVVGSEAPDGFFIVDTVANRAHGEDLQDHDQCPSAAN